MNLVVVDTSRILEKMERGILEEYFREYEASGNKLLISDRVFAELDGKFDDPEQKISFQTLIKEKIDSGLIIDSRHRYTLKKNFKELFRQLKHVPVHLSTTDRYLIALNVQENAYLDTTDTGIIRALNILKVSKNKWRKYMGLE